MAGVSRITAEEVMAIICNDDMDIGMDVELGDDTDSDGTDDEDLNLSLAGDSGDDENTSDALLDMLDDTSESGSWKQ